MRHPNLVGWWPLADNPNDYSGNGLNGTETSVLYGDTWKGRGWINNLSTSKISIADSSTHKPSIISVECSIETPSSWSSYPALLSKTTSTSWNDGYGFLFNADTTLRFCINHFNTYAGFALSGSTKYHIVGTYDLVSIKLYVDGELKSTAAYTTAIAHSTAPLLLGKPPGTDPAWSGKLTGIRIYNKVLGLDDVRRRYLNFNPMIL